MTCKKCGGELNSDDMICPICGEPIEETEKTENKPQSGGDFAADERNDEQSSGGNDKIDRTRILIVCFFAIIVFLIIFISLFGKYPVMYVFAPKMYAADVVGNTLVQINEEALERQKILPSLKKDSFKEYTLSASGVTQSGEAELKISSSKKKSEAYGELSYKTDSGETASLSAFINDDGLGVSASPETNEYFTLPSIITAEEWNNSPLREALGAAEIDSDADISYSAVSDGFYSQKTVSQLYSKTKSLRKSIEFSEKESTTLVIDGKNTKVKKLTFTIDGEVFKEYADELMEVIKSDEKIAEGVKERLDEISDSFDDNITFGDVKLIVYSSGKKAVEAKASIPIINGGEEFAVDISLAAAQTDNMTNNYMLEIAVIGGENPINISFYTADNGSGEEYDHSVTTTLEISSPNGTHINISSSFAYRKSDGAVSGRLTYENDDGGRTELIYSGILNDDDGFLLDLTDISVMTGGEPFEASLRVEVVPKMTEEMPEDIIEYPMLDMTETDILSALSAVMRAD